MESDLPDGPLRLLEHEDGSATFEFGRGTGRKCGDCTLCCTLLPVRDINKGAGTRCQYVRHKTGCRIYQHRPRSCRTWSCRWLCDPSTAGLGRPDRARYVIDLSYDDVRLQNDETGQVRAVRALQIWVDPRNPNAWRTPELRRYLYTAAEKYGLAAIIRFNQWKAKLLFAPPLNSQREWIEVDDATCMERETFEHPDNWKEKTGAAHV